MPKLLYPTAALSFLAQNCVPETEICQANTVLVTDFQTFYRVPPRSVYLYYLALKVKSAFAAPPAATVTLAVWVPRSSCHAVTV